MTNKAQEENFDDWTDASMSTDRTFTDGEVLVGTYKVRQQDIGPNGSNMYHIESVTEDGSREVVGLWGSSVIDSQFSRIPLESRVRIEFKGKETNQKSGRTFKNYDIKFKAPEGEQKFARDTVSQKDVIHDVFDEGEPVNLDDLPI